MPANLALCRRPSESQVPSCLEWETETSSETNSAVVKPSTEQQLKWRFEEGILRSIGDDGFASSLCLGPKTHTLFSDALAPYELILQTCPGAINQEQPKENIFSHHTSASSTIDSVQVGFEEQQQQALSIQQESEQDKDRLLDRHMRFLIGGDGRIRSLARVLDSNTSNTSSDLVAEKPFCLTVASSKIYLVPCMDHPDETRVYSSAAENTELPSPRSAPQIFKGDQQFLEPTANSSFDSFVLDWQNSQSTPDETVHLAYQIGFHGPAATNTPSMDTNQFDSFAMRVKPMDSEQQSDVLETTLEPGQTSGVRTYPASSFGFNDDHDNGQEVANMGAYLVGKPSNPSISAGVLASTSFRVHRIHDSLVATPTVVPLPETSSKFSLRLPWAHFFFWGFMICFAILIKLHRICRPSSSSKKDSKRASHSTVDTSAASQGSLHPSPSPSTTPSPLPPTHDFIIHHHQKRRRSSRGSFSSRDNSRRSKTSISMARCALQAQEQLRSNYNSPQSSYHSRGYNPYSPTNLAACSGHSRRNLYDWDEERPAQRGIDATQTTVNTNEELSERNYMEDGLDTMLCNSDIEDSIDEEQFDGEYDDIDIEARR